MTKVQFVVSGQVKDMPPKMADLLIRIGKARFVEAPTEAPVIRAPVVAVPEISTSAPQPVAVEPSAPVSTGPADVSTASFDFPVLDSEAKISDPEDSSEVTEVRQKRRYRRRDMTATD